MTFSDGGLCEFISSWMAKGSVKSVQPSAKSSCLATVLLAFACLSVVTV